MWPFSGEGRNPAGHCWPRGIVPCRYLQGKSHRRKPRRVHPKEERIAAWEKAQGARAMGKAKCDVAWRTRPELTLMARLAGIFCVAASLAVAHAVPSPQEPGPRERLLGAKDGRAIVKAAREHEQPAPGTQDCSHLVHEIYALAGFEYQYASSFDLYTGSENFERVKAPQPGDLIVWPGHAGIVLDPRKHSFYSLVRSGLDAEDYDGPYWTSRGKPRFFRYVVQGRENVLVAKSPAASRTAGTANQRTAAAVLGDRSDGDASEAQRSARAASERTTVIYGPKAPDAPSTTPEVPASIVIAEGRKQPTLEEVAEGISELSSAAGNVLRTDDPLKASTPVVIYDQLRVERLEFKRDHGWAHLQMDSAVSISGGETQLQKHRENVRWELRRTAAGWEAVTPLDRTYVPRDVAVPILAGQLAHLTQNDGGAGHGDAVLHQEAALASLLHALLGNK
jgi:hypothetical protein